jgi:lysozyme
MIRDQLLDLVKEFEGCKLEAYQDQVGKWTVGYGSTGPGINEDTVWTQEQADTRLIASLERFQAQIIKNTEMALGDNQLDALTSFVYNLGLGSYLKSTLKKKIEDKEFVEAADEFLKWDRVGGEVSPGILRRRKAERQLFLSGDLTSEIA